jgi:hypothetical protein
MGSAEPVVDRAAWPESGGALAEDKDWVGADSVWATLAAVRAASVRWARMTYVRFMVYLFELRSEN